MATHGHKWPEVVEWFLRNQIMIHSGEKLE